MQIAATPSVIRAPKITRDNISRPILSVPSQNLEEGPSQVLPTDSASPNGAMIGAKIAQKIKTDKSTIPIFAESVGLRKELLFVILLLKGMPKEWVYHN
ncbi:hypothetical protein OAK64_03305 [Deltaproteobacteria bacterium]|nr:hypothetical protein [Deltaproteobacteria bacterium]